MTYNDGQHRVGRHHLVVRPIMRAVADDLRAGQSVQLIGGRKLGKTVTLSWLAGALWGSQPLPERLVVRYSLQASGPDSGALFRGWCRAIERAARRVLRVADLKLVAPPVPGEWPAGRAFQVFREWLEDLIDAVGAEYGALPIVLAIDEGERFLDFAQPSVVLGQLRALIEAESALSLVVAGYHRLYAFRDDDDKLSPLRNLCKTRRMSLLDGHDTARLIEPMLDGIDAAGRDEMARWLAAETGGHPYLIQSLCHHMQRHGIAHPREIAEAFGDQLDHPRKAFRDWIAPWGEEARAIFEQARVGGVDGYLPASHLSAPVQLLCYAGAARLDEARLFAPVGRFNRWWASDVRQRAPERQ